MALVGDRPQIISFKMKKLRILHLARDDKFVDQAFFVFEKTFPKQNDVFIFARYFNLKYVKLNPARIVPVKRSRKRAPKIDEATYRKYDLVIFHSFNGTLYPEIFNIPDEIPTIWLGWGYDYYDFICSERKLFLPQTQSLLKILAEPIIRVVPGQFLRFCLEVSGISKPRNKAIEKLSFFSPVLPGEYDFVRTAKSWRKFPKSANWNYGTIEDDLLKGFEKEQVNGNAVLVGNSATPTCNHLESFTLLKKAGCLEREIIVPLSYGDPEYGSMIADSGARYFGKQFEPLMEFIPVKEYVKTIKKCGYVIMNHKRQQAIGNIIIMLYLGARIFIREECPTFYFFRNMGVLLSSVQELEENFALLDLPLTVAERERNRKLVSEYWSRDRGIQRTRALVEQACGA